MVVTLMTINKLKSKKMKSFKCYHIPRLKNENSSLFSMQHDNHNSMNRAKRKISQTLIKIGLILVLLGLIGVAGQEGEMLMLNNPSPHSAFVAAEEPMNLKLLESSVDTFLINPIITTTRFPSILLLNDENDKEEEEERDYNESDSKNIVVEIDENSRWKQQQQPDSNLSFKNDSNSKNKNITNSKSLNGGENSNFSSNNNSSSNTTIIVPKSVVFVNQTYNNPINVTKESIIKSDSQNLLAEELQQSIKNKQMIIIEHRELINSDKNNKILINEIENNLRQNNNSLVEKLKSDSNKSNNTNIDFLNTTNATRSSSALNHDKLNNNDNNIYKNHDIELKTDSSWANDSFSLSSLEYLDDDDEDLQDQEISDNANINKMKTSNNDKSTSNDNNNEVALIKSYSTKSSLLLSSSTPPAASDNNKKKRPKRSVVHLYDMIQCATGCNPLAYKGYGCYCGFLGSGLIVDGIDKCCAKHDWCYHHAKCPPLMTYFVPYYWTCNEGRPKCVTDYRGWKGICGAHLCECDRQFAQCLRKYPCPRGRAVCLSSPFRFWQNLIMVPQPYGYGW